MTMEINGIRNLSLDEWKYVSGGDGTPSVPPPGDPAPNTAVNDIYNQIVGLLGAISPNVTLSAGALAGASCPDCTWHVEACTMPDGSTGAQWVANEIDEFLIPCGEPGPDGQNP